MKKRWLPLFLALCVALVSLSSCEGSKPHQETQPTLAQNDTPQQTGKDQESSAAVVSEVPEDLPPEEELMEWTGWDEATLQSYLRSKLTYALYRDNYNLAQDEAKWLYHYTLDQFPFAVEDDFTVRMDVPVGTIIPGFCRDLNVFTDLYVGQAEASMSETELREWLCQGTKDSPWCSADVAIDYDGYGMSICYCNTAQFNTDGTCVLDSADEDYIFGIGTRGTYQVSEDKLTIQVTDIMEYGESTAPWTPAQKTLEYQLLPTKTSVALLQLSEDGFTLNSQKGETLAWQKGFPRDFSAPRKFPPKGKLDEAQLDTLCTQIANYYNEQWQPTGTYTCFWDDMEYKDNIYTFVLRYALSEEEAEEIIAGGGIPQPNTYVMEVYVDVNTGKVTNELDESTWKISLP